MVIEHLNKINNYEKTLNVIDSPKIKNLRAIIENKKIYLHIDGQILRKKLDRPIIHQIGSRIWKENSYPEIYNKWNSSDNLSSLIAQAFKFNRLKIKYNNSGEIYGIVPSNFHEVNPIEFRNILVNDLNTLIPVESLEKRINYTEYGEIVEYFNLFWDKSNVNLESPVKIDLGIVYGLNNGYSAFRIILTREILKCKNGLTEKTDNKIKWKHNHKISLIDFSRKTLNYVYSHHHEIKRRILKARETNLDYNLCKDFFNRLHIVQAAKDRVTDRLKVEFEIEGRNEWALSQALTNVGTHTYKGYGNRNNRDILIKAGTQILEKNLSKILKNEIRLINSQYGKTYDFLLPIKFSKK